MRLLDTTTLRLCTFHEPRLPNYAILSHTWASDDDEVTLQELRSLTGDALACQCGKVGRDQRTRKKTGYRKIKSFCDLARKDGFEYAWMDTCCIDKTNSTELSEAINSMYRWYKSSQTCYVYLVDVLSVERSANGLNHFKNSRYFRRGWTLQETLAPNQLKYFAKDWRLIGVTVRDATFLPTYDLCLCAVVFPGEQCLESAVSEASGIRIEHMRAFDPQLIDPNSVSIAERMSWAANRETTRLEDAAYSLLGIFNIDMPLIYGEGEKAFMRLQEEIIKHTIDKTILAWNRFDGDLSDQLLAPSPQYFKSANFLRQY